MSMNDSMQKIIKLFHRYKYFILVIAVGLALLLLPKLTSNDEKPQTVEESTLYPIDNMEKKLREALSMIENAGRVEVILTLKSDMEMVLATDEDTSQIREMEGGEVILSQNEAQYKTVLQSASGVTSPIITKRIYPQFRGALVICEGAGSATVQMAILEAVSSLTGLRGDAITICKMGSN